ncbi:hypothetical protein GEMRC1_011798 [Eukaryota sp. GEM-RC1]
MRSDVGSPLPSDPLGTASSKQLRSLWLRRSLRDNFPEFSDIVPMNILLCTFNVASKHPPSPDTLSSLVTSKSKSPDIICIGLQEVDMTASTLLVQEKSSIAEPWIDCFTTAVGSNYRLVLFKQLVGLLSILFVKTSTPPLLDMRAYTIGTGLMGRFGNKGAVIVTFRINESDVVIVNSHLAAHTDKVQRRLQDASDIISRFDHLYTQQTANQAVVASDDSILLPSSLFDYDYVFWIGDLNFRVNLDYNSVMDLIKQNNISKLLKYDQLLNCSSASESVFSLFKESPITFPPTFKLIPGTSNYIPLNPQKPRPPSFCDRCLYYNRFSGSVNVLEYDRREVLWSDHLPVVCNLDFESRVIDPQKRQVTLTRIKKELDKIVNSYIPTVQIDNKQIDFGSNIAYGDSIHQRVITITNNSPVIVFWSVVPEVPKWLYLSRLSGVIQPQEHTTVELSLPISDSSLFYHSRRNSFKYDLDDVLIVRLRGGGDSYITVAAGFKESWFGLDLSVSVTDDNKVSPILWNICDSIFSRGPPFMSSLLSTPLLSPDEFVERFVPIRDELDENGRILLDSASGCLSLMVLLHYLRSLPSSLIPMSLIGDCLKARSVFGSKEHCGSD